MAPIRLPRLSLVGKVATKVGACSIIVVVIIYVGIRIRLKVLLGVHMGYILEHTFIIHNHRLVVAVRVGQWSLPRSCGHSLSLMVRYERFAALTMLGCVRDSGTV